MGMLDSEVIFSAAQSTAAAPIGNTASTNSYNCGSVNDSDDAMTGENVWVNVVCNTPFTSSGAATVQALLQSAPDDATWTTAVAGPVLPISSVVAGTPLLQTQPPTGMQQYWQTVLVVGAYALTGGAVDSYVSNSIQRNTQRPAGFTVS